MPWSRCGQGEGADPPGDASGPQGAGAARLGQWRTGGSRPARGRTQLKAGPLHTAPLPTGALLLADPGCWSLARPRTLATTGASWLRRLDLHTHVVTPEGMRLDLPRWLDTAGTVPVTNVPAERLSLPKAVVLSRARWHVALLFKLWKQHGQMEQSRSRDPWRVLSELNGTLIALVTQ